MDDDQHDQRAYTRFAVDIPIQYRLQGEALFRDGHLDNISVGGINFRCQEALPLEQSLELLIQTAETDDTLQIAGTVLHCDPGSGTYRYRCGCRFDGLYSGPLLPDD